MSRQVNIRLDDETAEKVKAAAEQDRRSISDYIRGLILADLETKTEGK